MTYLVLSNRKGPVCHPWIFLKCRLCPVLRADCVLRGLCTERPSTARYGEVSAPRSTPRPAPVRAGPPADTGVCPPRAPPLTGLPCGGGWAAPWGCLAHRAASRLFLACSWAAGSPHPLVPGVPPLFCPAPPHPTEGPPSVPAFTFQGASGNMHHSVPTPAPQWPSAPRLSRSFQPPERAAAGTLFHP